MELSKRFEKHWLSQSFPSKAETILVAVSGGKDSMALAYLLLQSGHSISIAHCNYQLRADASNLDEELVTNWAKIHGITCHLIRFETEKEMAFRKMGVQETARLLRYNWFKELKQQYHYIAIATAHHANDNAETLLINLCKGTGIAGLHGIPPKNEDIIRPLLFANRASIDEYVSANKIPFREDESNSGTKYLRNKVRHLIIPALNEVFPNVVDRLNDSIQRFSQVEVIYKQAIVEEKKKLIEKRGADVYIPILKLLKRPAYEAVCYEIFEAFGFSSAQISEILRLLKSESGHYVSSISHRVIRDRNFLIITENKSENSELILVDQLPQTVDTEQGQFIFSLVEKFSDLSESSNQALIDYKFLEFPIVLRRRRTGDYFYPLGMGMKKKKISRFLIDQKIPLHLKEQVWIVESKVKIVWIAGMRLDERFKINNKTQKMLRILFLPK